QLGVDHRLERLEDLVLACHLLHSGKKAAASRAARSAGRMPAPEQARAERLPAMRGERGAQPVGVTRADHVRWSPADVGRVRVELRELRPGEALVHGVELEALLDEQLADGARGNLVMLEDHVQNL